MANITTVIFDMYETLAHNSPELWHRTFETIRQTQKLSIDPMELYRHWKTLEVNFRRDRLNLEEPEKSPPFKSYEQAWADCFQATFQDLGLPVMLHSVGLVHPHFPFNLEQFTSQLVRHPIQSLPGPRRAADYHGPFDDSSGLAELPGRAGICGAVLVLGDFTRSSLESRSLRPQCEPVETA